MTTSPPSTRKGKEINYASKDALYWRSLYFSAEARRREAWRNYYVQLNYCFKAMLLMRQLTELSTTPEVVKASYLELSEKVDTIKCGCPICNEQITVCTAKLTQCGHLCHEKCLSNILFCPVCRAAIVKTD
jgi:hypothetical protein